MQGQGFVPSGTRGLRYLMCSVLLAFLVLPQPLVQAQSETQRLQLDAILSTLEGSPSHAATTEPRPIDPSQTMLTFESLVRGDHLTQEQLSAMRKRGITLKGIDARMLVRGMYPMKIIRIYRGTEGVDFP